MPMIACPECTHQISDLASHCPHCGGPSRKGVTQNVTVGDIDMHFGTMVGFMVKAAVAAIPAAIILFATGAFAFGIVGAMFRR